jgi:hypothetical protein
MALNLAYPPTLNSTLPLLSLKVYAEAVRGAASKAVAMPENSPMRASLPEIIFFVLDVINATPHVYGEQRFPLSESSRY